jgi:hypothetical protein
MTQNTKVTSQQALAALIDAGLTFSEAVEVFAARQSEQDQTLIHLARERHHVDGEIEIDDDTILSESEDDGFYVMAWVWVNNPELTSDDDPRDGGQ